MPNVPLPIPAPPYDTVESVMNLARVRINDAIKSLSGDILQDSQPFSQVMANAGWRKFQAYLAYLGHSRFKQNAVLLAYPPMANTDPAIQPSLSWSGSFDGTSYYVSPALPQDFILPLKMWERQNGLKMPFGYPMRKSLDGLPSRITPQAFQYDWEWREDSLYFPGSFNTLDFRIEYAAFLQDFVTQGQGPGQVLWYNQPVPIMRCLSPLASFIAAEFAKPRADMDAQAFIDDAQAESKEIFNLEVRSNQRTTTSRKGFSMRHGRGY